MADQEFQTGMGGQPGGRELHSKIAVDAAAEIGFSSSHSLWPFVGVVKVGSTLFKPQREAFLQ